jgi:hypothetical protein
MLLQSLLQALARDRLHCLMAVTQQPEQELLLLLLLLLWSTLCWWLTGCTTLDVHQALTLRQERRCCWRYSRRSSSRC